jgi:hypothetical protein
MALISDQKEELIQFLQDSMYFQDDELSDEDIALSIQCDREIEEGLVKPFSHDELLKSFPRRSELIRLQSGGHC